MNGTSRPHGAVRLHGRSRLPLSGFFERPSGVLALVLTSSLVTIASSYVVISNAIDANRATEVEEVAQAQDSDPSPQRRYPTPDILQLALPHRGDPALQHRTAPFLAPLDPSERSLALNAPPDTAPPDRTRLIAGAPPLEPGPRPAPGLEVVAIARNMTPARAFALPRPTARPGAITPPTWPDPESGPQTSTLLARVSPRPPLRPTDITVLAAARAEDIDVEVARSEGPDAVGGLGESPRNGLFAGGGPCGPGLAQQIPRRSGNAPGASAVMASIGNGSGASRDDQLVREALNGNVPNFLRTLQPVTFSGAVNGRRRVVTICVTPDYLAIGSDRDHVRVPLGLPAALRVADAFDMMLPTTTMVDAIYRQADVRIAPSPMTPGAAMSSTNYFVRHDNTVDGQFSRAGAQAGMLLAGHKKDLVLANRLSRNPGRVAIYGWHRTNGQAIQPLSTVHGAYYADYSHGIRLVSRTAFVDGRAIDLRDLLTDESYADLLNSDGALTGATMRLASL